MNKNQKPSEMVIPSIRKCCWCGKPKKRGKGKSCMVSVSGLGKRYYWNCGCLDNYSFTEFTDTEIGEIVQEIAYKQHHEEQADDYLEKIYILREWLLRQSA